MSTDKVQALQQFITETGESLKRLREPQHPSVPRLQIERTIIDLEAMIVEAARMLSYFEGDPQVQWCSSWLGLTAPPTYH
jgi:hypothetical protein